MCMKGSKNCHLPVQHSVPIDCMCRQSLPFTLAILVFSTCSSKDSKKTEKNQNLPCLYIVVCTIVGIWCAWYMCMYVVNVICGILFMYLPGEKQKHRTDSICFCYSLFFNEIFFLCMHREKIKRRQKELLIILSIPIFLPSTFVHERTVFHSFPPCSILMYDFFWECFALLLLCCCSCCFWALIKYEYFHSTGTKVSLPQYALINHTNVRIKRFFSA